MGAATEPPTNEALLIPSLDGWTTQFQLQSSTKYSVHHLHNVPT